MPLRRSPEESVAEAFFSREGVKSWLNGGKAPWLSWVMEAFSGLPSNHGVLLECSGLPASFLHLFLALLGGYFVQRQSVAVLGSTGPVGQKVISMLEQSDRFLVEEVAASDLNLGKAYFDAVKWKNEFPLSARVAALTLKAPLDVKSRLVISALPTEQAIELEPALAARGHLVFSNAAAFRMSPGIPLLIPEVNSSHLELLSSQTTSGKLVTNPNCSTVFLMGALAPLARIAKIENVSVVTLQALSGAGYPGVSSFDLIGNVIPHIGGEENKIREEAKKILGTAAAPADFKLTVHVHRVPVLHGHTVATHVRFDRDVTVDEAKDAIRAYQEKFPGFLEFHTAEDRPQPARDLHPHDNRVHLGRLKQDDDSRTIGLIAMGHNLVRGAAGAAIANMEATLAFLGDAR
jgi:aspartate-semialdehyde dehydrogenase